MATISKRKSGSYQVLIRLSGMKPIIKTFKTKALATKFARTVEGDANLQLSLGKQSTKSITFSELVDLYMADYKGRDPSFPGRFKMWVKLFGDKQVTEITEFMVDDGLITLAKRVTGSTAKRYKSQLSATFIFFIKHPDYKRLGFSNPVLKESVSSFSENPSKLRFLSDSERSKLLTACKNSTWDKLYLLVLLAITTGMRKSEMMNLRFNDINFDKSLAILHDSKNGESRNNAIPETTMNELKKFRQVGNGLLFSGTKTVKGIEVPTDKPFEFRSRWNTALKEAGITSFRFHDLRHTAASYLVMNGATLKETAEVLGHKSTQTTDRYAHLSTEHKSKLIERVMGKVG